MQSIIQSIVPIMSVSNAVLILHCGLKERQNDDKLSKTNVALKIDHLRVAGIRVPEFGCQTHFQQYTVNRDAAAI
jgi:hypothetical protein